MELLGGRGRTQKPQKAHTKAEEPWPFGYLVRNAVLHALGGNAAVLPVFRNGEGWGSLGFGFDAVGGGFDDEDVVRVDERHDRWLVGLVRRCR
jgi:hypothetical protein